MSIKDEIREDQRGIDKEKSKQQKKKKKEERKVAYGLNGKAIRGALPLWKKIVIGIAAFIALLCAFIYLPPMMGIGEEESSHSYVAIMPDSAAIKAYQTYLKDNQEADFDGDGLTNSVESDHNTNVWNIDSDNDGVSDYAEIFSTGTDPVKPTTILVKQIMKDDERNGSNLGIPYKIDDIVFWPNTYQAKAYGAVVRTLRGYRFCNFDGWIKFPQQVYAYQYKDGSHREIDHRTEEDAWRIKSSDEVVLYGEPLTFVYRLTLPIAGVIYLPDDGLGSFLADILPNKGGFVNCIKMATIDTKAHEDSYVTAELRAPTIDKTDYSRLGQNMNSLKDLTWVRKMIEAGECVAVSMYSGNVGESIGIIYGYTDNGDLLVANEDLEPAGILEIAENAKRMMDKDNVIGQVSWFEWKGLGFDSKKYGDRISFFTSTREIATDNDIEEDQPIDDDAEIIITDDLVG